MALEVAYVKCSKKSYIDSENKLPNYLYYCEDTRELYKGEDLYADGVRIVENYSSLPEFLLAADGVIYFCSDTGSGYAVNGNRDGWIQIFSGVDGKTITINNGLMSIKTVPLDLVDGLEERLKKVEPKVATNTTAGVVLASSEVEVDSNGVMSIGAIPQGKIIGLEERLDDFEEKLDTVCASVSMGVF
jgi:hypothetical protein